MSIVNSMSNAYCIFNNCNIILTIIVLHLIREDWRLPYPITYYKFSRRSISR